MSGFGSRFTSGFGGGALGSGGRSTRGSGRGAGAGGSGFGGAMLLHRSTIAAGSE
jgi:hypothetical protein